MKFFCDFGDGPKIGVSDYSLIPPGGDTNDTKSWKEGLLEEEKNKTNKYRFYHLVFKGPFLQKSQQL